MTRRILQPRENTKQGILYVVATPIGNLSDISDRAREVLAKVAVVAAEDTRHSGQLLKHFGIDTPLWSLHEHNETQRAREVVARLLKGDDVALVSDAGTPLISDPGFDVVREVIAAGIRVVPIPGACAALAALSASGLPTDRFSFQGFLPAKAAARTGKLRVLRSESATLIFYEAPHRLQETLRALAEELGSRSAVVARELTKQYESFYFGTLDDLASRASADESMRRGESVILVAGAPDAPQGSTLDAETVLRVLLEELPPSQAAKLAAKLTGAKRGDLYDQALALGKK